MTTAADLHALQETDLALDKARQRLAEIEESLGESEELREARRVTEEHREAVAALRARQTELEWSVDEVRSKASEIEAKLYGGSVSSPKELSDLQADLNSLKSQVRKREDVLLGMLLEVEEAEGHFRAAESVLAEVQAAWDEAQRALLEEKAQLEPESSRLEKTRQAQVQGMDRAALRLYQLLRDRRDGLAVSRVERGMCQGCRITLPMSVLQRARTGLGLVQCVSCERILLVS